MSDYIIDFLPVESAAYGAYNILKLDGFTFKELKKQDKLMQAIGEVFGMRFVIVREEPGKERDYMLNESIIGIPTPEFERQIKSGEWQQKAIALGK